MSEVILRTKDQIISDVVAIVSKEMGKAVCEAVEIGDGVASCEVVVRQKNIKRISVKLEQDLLVPGQSIRKLAVDKVR